MANSEVELPPDNYNQRKRGPKSPPGNSKSHEHPFGRNIKRLFRFWQRIDANPEDELQQLVAAHLTSADSNSGKQQMSGAQQQDNAIQQQTTLQPPTHLQAANLQPQQQFQNQPMFAVDQRPELLIENSDSVMEESALVDPLSGLHAIILTWLYNNNRIDTFWQDMESRTGQSRVTLTYLVLGSAIGFMIMSNFSEVVCSLVGIFYPLMCTYEMLRLDPEDVPAPLFRHWIHYWCIFGVVTGFDFIGRVFPFYNMIKASILLLSAIPDLGLSNVIFSYSVRPVAKFGILLLKKYAVL